MHYIIGTPSRYIQGREVLSGLHQYIGNYGSHFLMIADQQVHGILAEAIDTGTGEGKPAVTWERFGGECTAQEAQRLEAVFADRRCDGVIGAGGGKALDTAKVVAHRRGVPLVIIPTAASTDAPCSSIAIVHEEGKLPVDWNLPRSPDLVLVDTGVIAKAPVRLLVAGMGDAFATYYEARACRASGAANSFGGRGSNSSFALAELCQRILLEDGEKALVAVKTGTISRALENIVEANIYLSGVGFENNGCAVAHGIYNGFVAYLQDYSFLHGECVAFGVLVQLVCENVSLGEIREVQTFYRRIGLPLTLGEIGWPDATRQELREAATAACGDALVHHMPFPVTEETLWEAIVQADALGHSFTL